MAHFWDSQGKHGRSSEKRRWSRQRGGEPLCRTNPCQEGQSQQHQRDVSVPASEAANLIVIQSEVFGVFKILFNVPAGANGRHHLWQGGCLWGKNEVVRFLVGIGEAAADEHPMASIIFPPMQHGYSRPVKQSGTLGAFTHREALPIKGSKPEGFYFTDLHASALTIKRQYSHRLITGNDQHIRVLMGFQPRTQIQIAAIDRISHHPGNGDSSLPEAFDHLDCQFWLRLEAHRFWNTSSAPAIAILTPVQGQIEFAINEGVPFGRHIREKDPHLTVLDLARRSTILEANAGRLLAPLGKAGFIDGQDGRLLAQLLKGVGTQVIAHTVSVPHGSSEQTLHPIGARFSSVFGQLPPIFALRVTQDALQVSQRPAERLWTSKAWSNAGMQTRKALEPATDIGGRRGLVNACDMVILLHLLLLSASALWFAVSHLQSVIFARRRGDFFTRFRSLLSS